MRKLMLMLISFFILPLLPIKAHSNYKEWGSIGNPGHEDQLIFSTIYFPGVPWDNIYSYGDKGQYTASPLVMEESFDKESIRMQLKRMKKAGINVVFITYWGRNYFWGSGGLPMNATDGDPSGNVLATYTRLIKIIEEEKMLFAPHIDVNYFFGLIKFVFKLYYGFDLDINILNAYCFLTQFPHDTNNLEERIAWWVKNFGDSDSWLEVYNNEVDDDERKPKKVISLIETIMPDYPFLDGLPFDPFVYDAQKFSDGFTRIAENIAKDHNGFAIGFSVDPTPIGPAWLYANFKPRPEDLLGNKHILFVMFWDVTNEGFSYAERMVIAIAYFEKWKDFPMVAFLMTGWKGNLVFPWTIPYGMDKEWRKLQKLLIVYATAGISFGSWNGWTEWFHVTCSQEHGSMNLKWTYECIQIRKGIPVTDSSHLRCPND